MIVALPNGNGASFFQVRACQGKIETSYSQQSRNVLF